MRSDSSSNENTCSCSSGFRARIVRRSFRGLAILWFLLWLLLLFDGGGGGGSGGDDGDGGGDGDDGGGGDSGGDGGGCLLVAWCGLFGSGGC